LVVCRKTALYEQFSPASGPHWFAWMSMSCKHDGCYRQRQITSYISC
jgi:hypothetical protein